MMRLLSAVAATVLVLVVLATTFPAAIVAQRGAYLTLDDYNTRDHIEFAKELAKQGADIEALRDQSKPMTLVPERVARIEERLDNIVKIVYAILGGVGALLLKELGWLLKTIKVRKGEAGAEG
jgi:hypothetical protein